MRKPLLTIVSVLGLGLVGTAFAADQDQRDQQAGQTSATEAEVEAGVPALEPSYRSFKQAGVSISGPVAAGMTAEEIIGREVVDENGETIGTVHDLLIGEDDLARAILIDTGAAAAGGGTPQYVAVLVAHVLEEQGAGGNLVVNVNPDELQQLPAWEQQGDTWTQAS